MSIARTGSGYVGLVSGTCCADRDARKIARHGDGILPIHDERGLDMILKRHHAAGFQVTGADQPAAAVINPASKWPSQPFSPFAAPKSRTDTNDWKLSQ
jgi:UDP-glucose 6-dehydrogenase